MFSFKLFFTTLSALSAFYLAGAMPTGLTPRADWKTELGWDGKVVTPFELDPKNAVNAITGKRAAVGGVYFCSEANYGGKCAYVTGFKSGDCVGVGRDFNDNVSSFGPDDRLSCTIFR
ncbi:hypothetical protein FRC09_009616 [Ceratobasidium sp. 395]|nr:hypothetical protein FRC09_009616 [Ceratobasidium sp. 395]